MINRRHGVDVRVRNAQQRGARVGVGSPVVGEIWGGIENSDAPEKYRPKARRALSKLVVWPFDEAAAEEFGRLFAQLRKKGRAMQQIDIQIAAIALTLGNCTVVTKDSDFQAIPGLDIEDWSKP